MPPKVYIKPPAPARNMFIAQIALCALFLLCGPLFVFISERETRPFVVVFALIWTAGCAFLIVHAVKAMRSMSKGRIEIAELESVTGEMEQGFASRLRDLEALKRDGFISDAEYRQKRAAILREKW